MPAPMSVSATFRGARPGRNRARRKRHHVDREDRRRCVESPTLTAFPVTRSHAPAVALAYPLMRDPMMSGMGRRPASLDPFMPSADPIPVSADPYVSRRGGHADDLYTRRRRRHHHHPVSIIVTLVGNDHAPRQGHDEHQPGCRGRPRPLTLIHENNNHVLQERIDELTS